VFAWIALGFQVLYGGKDSITKFIHGTTNHVNRFGQLIY
jgi:hypothetical protein